MKMTSPLMVELHQDHLNIVSLVVIAEGVLLAMATDDDPDYELLEDVMRYLTTYSDAQHHPNEDVVFEVLEQRVPEVASKVKAIASEHDLLVAQGKRVLEAIEGLQAEAILSRADLLQDARTYFAALRSHMSLEETVLFPLADRRLTEADWHSIRERILVGTDPLFGPTKSADLRRLWERIEAHRQTS